MARALTAPPCHSFARRCRDERVVGLHPSRTGTPVVRVGLGVDAFLASGLTALPISVDHAERAPRLPPHHRDPFDRMLVAQSQLERLTLVTDDHTLGAYNVELIDAVR
jgi:hypothetical protein